MTPTDTQEGEESLQSATIRLQPLPMVSSEKLRVKKNAGYCSQIAETHMKGMVMISMSPDSFIFPYKEKHKIP